MSLQVPMWSCGWWWPETLSSKVTQVVFLVTQVVFPAGDFV